MKTTSTTKSQGLPWASAATGMCLVAAILVSGCDRAEYEAHLARTQERLRHLDEENALLGYPVLPGDRPPAVFIRLPANVSATAKPVADSPWLQRFPWANRRDLVPVVEVYLGAATRSLNIQEVVAEFASTIERQGGQRIGEPATRGTLTRFVRLADPESDRVPVELMHFSYQSREKPNWPGDGPTELPAAVVYRYDLFIDDSPTGWWVVVAFKQLDRNATELLWREQGVSAAWLLRLPRFDAERVARQRQLALATLRTGAAARTAAQWWRN